MAADPQPIDPKTDDVWAAWRARLKASRRRADDLATEWQENVDRRRVRVAETTTPSKTKVSVPKDWSLTKAKIAQLYSQTPEVRLEARSPQFESAVQPFAKELNDTITDCNVGATIEEELADVINKSGIAAVIVSCEKRTQQVMVPMMDPVIAMMTGQPNELTPVTQVADIQYLVERISPDDLLVPSDFTGSDYNKARWLAREGRMTWAQAVQALGVTEDEKDEILGRDKRSTRPGSTDTDKYRDTEVVNYTEVFYWRHFYHDDETNFRALQRLVFVADVEAPKIDEPYQAQVRLPDGRLVGVVRNPIQVLTLTYISDDCLPPSDSSVSRFQIAELEESRDAMVQQRKHSIPIRWGDTNRISTNTRTAIEKGTHQGFIWVNGPGDRAIGEVARASFPQERFEFDRVIGNDLTENFQVGTNQAGAFASGERSAREASIIEKNFQRRVGIEQDKVQKHFLGMVEVLAGHLAVYGTFTLPDELGPMRQQIANAFTYSVRVDSTVRLDADEQIDRLTKGLNLTAQSGYVNPKPVIAQIWSLLGVDPGTVVIDPQPKPPEAVKLSASDPLALHDPLFLAYTMRTQQAPGVEDVTAAEKLLEYVHSLGMQLVPAQTPGSPVPGEVQTPGIANAGWEAAPRIDRRQEDGGA